MKKSNLDPTEYHPYFQNYIDQNKEDDLLTGLIIGKRSMLKFFKSIPQEKHEYRYAEHKWTIKELLLHLIDSERMFAYRALAVARGDTQNLPGFNENAYVPNSNANNRTLKSLVNEYNVVRNATICLFEGLTEDMLERIGKANNSPISARAIGFIIPGHEAHHCKVIRDRYL